MIRAFLITLVLAVAPPGAASDGVIDLGVRIMDPSLPATPSTKGSDAQPAWFWREVSTDIAAASPARWPRIVRSLEQSRLVAEPATGALRRAQKVAARWGTLIRREAARRKISVPLLVAVIAVESAGNPKAISPKGAGGLMQLMPQTARRFGVLNSLAPAQNVRGGARYLDWLLKEFNEDTVLALAAYNAGEGAVRRHGGVPPYRETRNYVAKVSTVFAVARRLCADPPSGPRDPCTLQ